MNGKKTIGALACFAAGLTAGYLIAQYAGGRLFGDEPERRGEEKPPLRVKPVPVAKKSVPVSGPGETDGAPRGNAE